MDKSSQASVPAEGRKLLHTLYVKDVCSQSNVPADELLSLRKKQETSITRGKQPRDICKICMNCWKQPTLSRS